jgi:hypothetical protein
MSSNTIRRALLGLAAVGSLTLAGCASLAPRELLLSQAELQTLLERQFPRQQRVLDLLDVNLLRPRVRLAPERNRIVTALDLNATERLSQRRLSGSVAFEHGLRYEPSDATVRLADVRVEDLKLDVAGTALSGAMARIGTLLAERALDEFVLYRLGDERREALRRAGLESASFAVMARGVELRFAPKR